MFRVSNIKQNGVMIAKHSYTNDLITHKNHILPN